MPSFRIRAFYAGAVLALSSGLCDSQSSTSSQVALTNAAQIRKLTAAAAGKSIPVHLKGVVITEASPDRRAVVIHDESAGIYLLATNDMFSATRRADLIEVDGVTDPGQFAPIVRVSKAHKVGTAPAPHGTPATLGELLTGGLDAQWVEVSGVVRNVDNRVSGNTNQWRMEMALGGGKVSVVLGNPKPAETLIDARVRVQATCFYQFTPGRKVLKPILFVPGGMPIEIIEPAPVSTNAPLRPAGSLLEFSPENTSGHRVHFRGVVTHQEPGTSVWIRDESGALRIQTRQSDILDPGDTIDVLGFPKYGSYTPTLEDAIFSRIGAGTPPAAVPLATAPAAFDHPGDLISMEATLTDIEPTPDGWALDLQKVQGASFKAIFKPAANRAFQIRAQAGSVVRVTGICSVITDDSEPVASGLWQPQTFQLLLRAPADVLTLKEPPWWTPRRIILVLVVATVALALITALVMWLARQRLREQARQRAMAAAEFTAILSERNRLAREIHDTLAQGLAATSVQLRLAKKHLDGGPEQLEHHLDSAQNLVRGSLEEARNSIWNMRSHVLENGDLAEALSGILKQMADGTEVATTFETTGRTRRLAPVIENNLLRIGQEAITNATKHAGAKHIRVGLDFGEKRLCLTVNDDGRGFDALHPPQSQGGFGLLGMRERATDLNGDLKVQSSPGEGTTVNLTVPLSGE
jgi:signal transduction histidine kinase